MASMNIEIKTNSKSKIVVEMNADKFEKMAANFGFFGDDFLKSLNKSEKDYKAGRVKKISSLSSIK